MSNEPYISNCLFFVISHMYSDGGYAVMRRSHYVWWLPHFEWSPDLEHFIEFTPIHPKVLRWFPPLMFKGKVQVGT